MPIPAAARMVRPQRCENCALHGMMDDGQNLDCRAEPPKYYAIPNGQGGVTFNSMFPMTRREWFCGRWRALVEMASSLAEATK